MTNLLRPEQRLRMSQKDKDWQDRNVIYWCGRTNLYPVINSDALVLYLAAGGKIDESVYTYITNPLNSKDEKLQGYPARMRNIDILTPNIQTLMGELSERFFNPIVVALNSNYQSEKEKKEYDLRLEQLKQQFVNGLIQKGLLPEEIQQTPMPDAILNKMVSSVKNQLALMGQHAINHILQDKEIDKIRRKTFYDFIVVSRFFTYKDVQNDDLVYYAVSPLEISFTNTPNIDFVEDAEAVKRGVTLPLSEVIDLMSDIEGFEEILPEIEAKLNVLGYQSVYTGITTDMLRGDMSQPFTTQTEGIFLEHINWTSLKLMKKVTGIDPFGNEYEEHYDEDYEPLIDEKVEEYWINEKWEGYRLDGTHILGVQPIPFQRGTYANPNKCKNLYNGKIFMNNYIIPQSIVEKGLVYQIKYNIAHYHLEKIMAKNKDKIMPLPLGIIPQKEGWDEFTMMYYADAHGYLFMDETNPQVMQALQYMKSIDMSLNQYIKEMYEILARIKQDWDESIGISRQRKGGVMASDGKGTTEEAIYRSSIISEEFFKQHEETIVRDLQGLMDLSKVAWRKGKKGVYVSTDYKAVEFDIDSSVYPNSEHNVFVKNSSTAFKEVEAMKAQIGTIAQQTQNFSILPRIVQSTNMPELIEQLEEVERRLEENQKAAEEREARLAEAELESKENDRQLKIYEIDENNETKKEVALLNAEANILSYQQGENENEGVNDTIKLEELYNKRIEALEKIKIEREKLIEAKNKRIDETKLTRENMQNDKEVALINARNRANKTKK